MLFRVLGAVGAQRGADAVALGGPKPRALLAALLLAEGRVLPVSRLIAVIWDDHPPESAPALLHTYVSALRRACGPGAGSIVTEPPGYRIDLTGCTLDYQEFTRLAKQSAAAAAAGDHETAARTGRAALAHWQGPALSGLKTAFADAESARLTDLRLAVTEDVFEAEIALGRGAALVDDLRTLVAEHPLRERLRGQLMTALWSAGRQADALGVYRDGRRLLVEELGVEPGPELRARHERMLRGDGNPAAVAAAEPEPEPVAGPCLLPPDITDFTGRGTEAGKLTGTAARIVAVSGKPGSGKSSLAVHAAHRLRPRFPDGQLYVDLRGARETPVEPVAVLGRFLRALGVPDAELPAELDERVELYRMVTARRRLLVVLDDAAGERQVRPLLPSGPDCLCVITSRVRPAALEAAEHLGLGVLGDDDCLALLARIVGLERLAREPEQARLLVHLCGNLPLAVRIAGARLAARPDWPPSRLVSRLQEQRKSLNELAIGDLEVRGSLALSYHSLDEPQRTALRRLGWLGVPDFAAWLVSPLLEVSPDDAEDVVEALVRAQLLDVVSTEDTAPTRYRLHDLTRVFAWERAEAEEDHDVLRAAVERATAEWQRLVEWASGGSPMRALHKRAAGRVPGRVPTAALGDPRAWFDTEQTALVHVVERAGALGLADAAVRLATTLCASSFAVENHFHHWWRTHTAALAAARRADDLCGQGLLLSGLGLLRAEQDRYDEAADYYREALDAYAGIADPVGESTVRVLLSGVHREQGKLAEALDLLDGVLPALAAADDVTTSAQARHWRGMVLTELGRLDESLVDYDAALAGYRSLPDEHGVALVVRSIGITHRAAGRLAAAERRCAEALEMLRGKGDRLMSAYAAQSLAKVHIRRGNRPWDQVHAVLTEALETCHGMQDGFGQALMLRTLGELELARHRPDAARRRLEHALTWCDALAVPLWRARTLRDLAVVLDCLGLPEEAGRTHAEAQALFVTCGSREAREPRLPAPRRQPAEDLPGS
ncbi:BTAD domain-containing putative transcriptional regulator [Amycolatopsis sp. NPDC003861]